MAPKKRFSIHEKSSKLLLLSVLTLLCLFSFFSLVAAQTTAESQCNIGQVYLDGKGCITPKFTADYTVYPSPEGKLSSSLGDVQVIRINNPYAAAGEPVVVDFTLQNIGDQMGYPFDQINLPPNVYALQLAVDKDIGVIMADGRRVDVWGTMTGTQKVSSLLCLGSKQFWEQVTKTLAGRTCGYVEMTKCLPQNVNDKLKDLNNGKAAKVYTWECIKIVDMPEFNDRIKAYCGTNIDSACVSKLNQNLGNAVNDVVTVLLSDGVKSNLAKGECERPNSGTFWKSFGGYLAGNVNVVQCSIGENGLKPGDSATFKFVALVPADTPTVSAQGISELTDIKNADKELYGGYTESASCIDSSNPKACHTVYGAVYPAAQENLISWLADKGKTVLDLFGCSGSYLWNLGKSDVKGCMAYGHSGIDVVGEPLWEGQGTFYVIGAALNAVITFTLWGAFASGYITALRRGG